MSHDHSHTHHKRTLFFAILIALFFMIVEVVGGIVANSLALISDALHLFADVGALGLSWVAAHLVQKPATKKLSYGYQRAEVLGALASALILWALCGVLIYEAITRFFHPEVVEGGLVSIIATIGLIANIAMMQLLHPVKKDNLNMRAAYLHVLGDLLGSIGIIVSGILIWLTGWNPLDPIISFVFAISILFGSGKIIRQSVVVLMQSAPPSVNVEAVHKALEELPGVEEVHDLHIWCISSTQPALTVHLVAPNPQATLTSAQRLLDEEFNICHATIQIEDHDHFDPKYCYDCQKKS